jgi:YVTN family beta-propeller protein
MNARLGLALGVGILGACSSSSTPTNNPDATTVAERLFVAHEGSLVSYDVATGKELPGAVQNVTQPVDMQVLDDGTVLVNLTDRGEILVVDGKTMLEIARLPSSGIGGTRPVHSYLSPTHGKRFWMTLNDGTGGKPETNSARFVDIDPKSPSYLKPVGEVAIGVGHHKATFSTKLERVVVTNIGDCENVLSVYDYSNVASITKLATLSAKDAGFDGSSRDKTCDPTFQNGAPPAPHGCATSKVTGKAYCNLTTPGDIVVVDVDASPPTFKSLKTGGAGGGYTKAHKDGRFVYSLQESPREGDMKKPGPSCQIGQLVVVDTQSESIAKELPLLYKGPGCADVLKGTDEETDNPSHMHVSADGKLLFVTLGGGFEVESARVRQQVLVDLSDPGNPVQLPSIATGVGTRHRGDALSGDGRFFFATNTSDGSVTQIDVATRAVVATIITKPTPLALASFGPAGPSVQTGPIH